MRDGEVNGRVGALSPRRFRSGLASGESADGYSRFGRVGVLGPACWDRI